MAQDSKRKRYIRRLKRERTVALRIMDQALLERNMARQILNDIIIKTNESVEVETKKPDAEPQLPSGSETRVRET